MAAVLRAEGLSKRFGGLKANDEVSIALEQGQILGLIGPNGAGKSTCFAMLAGSIPPTAGRIFVGDREVTGQPGFRIARAGVVRTHQIVRPFKNLTPGLAPYSRAVLFRWRHSCLEPSFLPGLSSPARPFL